jgi:dTDP-D-glucose 4,6-dehydratase
VRSWWKRILFGLVCLDICVRTILAELGKPESFITYVKDRLGHDRRYGIILEKPDGITGWIFSQDVENLNIK